LGYILHQNPPLTRDSTSDAPNVWLSLEPPNYEREFVNENSCIYRQDSSQVRVEKPYLLGTARASWQQTRSF